MSSPDVFSEAESRRLLELAATSASTVTCSAIKTCKNADVALCEAKKNTANELTAVGLIQGLVAVIDELEAKVIDETRAVLAADDANRPRAVGRLTSAREAYLRAADEFVSKMASVVTGAKRAAAISASASAPAAAPAG